MKNNTLLGKITSLLNIIIFIFFIISMILLMRFNTTNIKFVDKTPVYNKVLDEFHAIQQPTRVDSANVALYQYRIDTLTRSINLATDAKNKKTLAENKIKIAEILKEKELLKATHDSLLMLKQAEYEPVANTYIACKDEQVKAKSNFNTMIYITLILFIIKIIFFALWNYKNSINIRISTDWGKKESQSFWSFVGWIIPVYNLIRPYSFFNELNNDTEYLLQSKNIIPENYDNKGNSEFFIGLWWAFYILATGLGTIFLNNTFFCTGSMYEKLNHLNVVIIIAIFWTIYIFLEIFVIFKYNCLNKLLVDNKDKL